MEFVIYGWITGVTGDTGDAGNFLRRKFPTPFKEFVRGLRK